MENLIPLELVELEPGSYHIVVKASFNEYPDGYWLLDTGASKSVFDSNCAELFVSDELANTAAHGIGKDAVEASTGAIAKLNINGIDYGKLHVAIVDLLHINNEYSKFCNKRIIGLLGSDFFFRTNAVIDYNLMILRTINSEIKS